MTRLLLIALWLFALPVSLPAAEDGPGADDQALLKKLEAVIRDAHSAYGEENLPDYLRTLHLDSLHYGRSIPLTKQQFAMADIQPALHAFALVGVQNGYAIGIAQVTLTETTGLHLTYNRLELLYVFRTYQGKWKIWEETLLARGHVTAPPDAP